MLYCPYCIGDKTVPQSPETFRWGAGHVSVDTVNKVTLEFAIHSHGCGRVFLVLVGGVSRDTVVCFKLPVGWDQQPPQQNPPPVPPF